MNSIGADVRQERERQGLSLEEVSERTRITVRNLEAIEQDDFESFPNRVYARAFLRDYANFLGLDSAELLERYEEQRAGEPVPAPPAEPRRGTRPAAYVGLAVLVACVLGGGAYVGWRLHDEYLQTSREAAKARQPKAPHEASLPPPPQLPEPASGGSQSTVAASQSQTQTAAGENTLTLTALGTVWVHLDVDGRRLIYTNLSPGTTRTYHPKKKIFLHVGKANAVKVEYNGKSVELGVKSNPAKWGISIRQF